jgi:hypothetical protein
MRKPVAAVVGWIFKNIVNLVLLIAILLGGNYLYREWQALSRLEQDQQILVGSERAIREFRRQAEVALIGRVPAPGTPVPQLEQKLMLLESELSEKRESRNKLWRSSPVERHLPTAKVYRELIELDIEIALYEQGLRYTRTIYEVLRNARQAEDRLRQLDADSARLGQAIYQNKVAQYRLSKEHAVLWRIPGTDPYEQMKKLEHGEKSFEQEKVGVDTRIRELKVLVDQLKKMEAPPPFSVVSGPIDDLIKTLSVEIAKIDDTLKGSSIQKFLRPLLDVLPTAGMILGGAWLAFLMVKLIMYYAVAPWAARRPAICLLPETTGHIALSDGGSGTPPSVPPQNSTVSLSLVLDQGSCLLVVPNYLQGAALSAKKDTKWLLDWSMPLSSLASGMYGLMRIFPHGSERITISSSADPLVELSIVDVPADSAIVLQPRSLVGIVQNTDRPMRITWHWRLGSLSAWLTLQLRYIVFHGPVKLIVKGCRAVRLEPVATGRAVNQAATLGFSANLSYAVARNETFLSYLTGERELFNDRWAGERGFCVYAETPHPDARVGLLGRRIAGMVDSILKVLGL